MTEAIQEEINLEIQIEKVGQVEIGHLKPEAMRQWMPQIARNQETLEKAKLGEDVWFCHHGNCRLLTSRTEREYMSVV